MGASLATSAGHGNRWRCRALSLRFDGRAQCSMRSHLGEQTRISDASLGRTLGQAKEALRRKIARPEGGLFRLIAMENVISFSRGQGPGCCTYFRPMK